MAVIAEESFDTQVDGSPVSPSSSWSIAGSVPVADDAAAIHGVLGCRWADTSTFGRMQYDSGANQSSARVFSFYFRINTFSSVVQYIATIYSLVSGGSNQGDWRVNTNRTVSIRDANVAVGTSSETLSEGIIYRAEWRLDPTSNTQELRIYEGEATAILFTLSGAWSSDLTRVFTIGPSAAASGGSIDYDTVKFGDDWVGPENPPALLTPVLRRYYYHNGQWV